MNRDESPDGFENETALLFMSLPLIFCTLLSMSLFYSYKFLNIDYKWWYSGLRKIKVHILNLTATFFLTF